MWSDGRGLTGDSPRMMSRFRFPSLRSSQQHPLFAFPACPSRVSAPRANPVPRPERDGHPDLGRLKRHPADGFPFGAAGGVDFLIPDMGDGEHLGCRGDVAAHHCLHGRSHTGHEPGSGFRCFLQARRLPAAVPVIAARMRRVMTPPKSSVRGGALPARCTSRPPQCRLRACPSTSRRLGCCLSRRMGQRRDRQGGKRR